MDGQFWLCLRCRENLLFEADGSVSVRMNNVEKHSRWEFGSCKFVGLISEGLHGRDPCLRHVSFVGTFILQ